MGAQPSLQSPQAFTVRDVQVIGHHATCRKHLTAAAANWLFIIKGRVAELWYIRLQPHPQQCSAWGLQQQSATADSWRMVEK